MGTGDLFCSLGALGLAAAEPFSAMAVAPECEVHVLRHSQMMKLPAELRLALRRTLLRGITSRVKRQCVEKSTRHKPMQSPRDTVFADFRDAPVSGYVAR